MDLDIELFEQVADHGAVMGVQYLLLMCVGAA